MKNILCILYSIKTNMQNENLLDKLNNLKDTYYQNNTKNTFFKNKQKKNCAEMISNSINMNTL